jgi:hypothetical protein
MSPQSAQSALPPPGQSGQGGPPPMQPSQNGQGGGQSSQMLDQIRQIISSARMLGQMVPGAVPIIQQINDLAQQLQAKIIQTGPAPEPVAPPM